MEQTELIQKEIHNSLEKVKLQLDYIKEVLQYSFASPFETLNEI